MNPVLRLVSGHGANSEPSAGESSGSAGVSSDSAIEPTHEFVPGFKARPAGSPASVSATPAGSDDAHASLLQTGHLVRCRRCGELNGRSADACWNCEAGLEFGTLPTGLPPPAANADAAPSSLFPDVPLLTSPVSSNELRSTYGGAMPAPMPPASVRRGPGTGLVATIAVVMMVLAGGGLYYVFDNHESEAARNAAAAAMRPRPAAVVEPSAVAPSVGVAPSLGVEAPPASSGELSSVDAALRAAELVSQQAKPDSMAVYVAPSERVIAASAKTRSAASAGTPGAASRSRAAARNTAPGNVALPRAPALPTRAPAAAAGPCTPNVAALGLCSAPASNQNKE